MHKICVQALSDCQIPYADPFHSIHQEHGKKVSISLGKWTSPRTGVFPGIVSVRVRGPRVNTNKKANLTTWEDQNGKLGGHNAQFSGSWGNHYQEQINEIGETSPMNYQMTVCTGCNPFVIYWVLHHQELLLSNESKGGGGYESIAGHSHILGEDALHLCFTCFRLTAVVCTEKFFWEI